MGIKDFLEINPVLLATLIGALGLKDILWAFVQRLWKKTDEKEDDHKKLEEIEEKLDVLILKIEQLEANDKISTETDLRILEHTISTMQNRAILADKVSNSCMPRYSKLYKLYSKQCERNPDYDMAEEIEMNHQRIMQIVKEGKVVGSLEEWYK